MFQRILVPLDGSEFAETVLPYAQVLAKRIQSELVLLQVVPYPHELVPSDATMHETAAHTYLATIQARLQSTGLRVEIVTRAGPPAETIIDYASESGVELIAMSAHGRSGVISRWVYGSIADKVLRGANVPTLLVRTSPAEIPASLKGYQRILVPLDGSELAEGALRYAKTLVTLFGAHLILIRVPVLPTYVYASVELTYSVQHEMSVANDEAATYLNNVTRRLVQEGLSVEAVVEWGPVAETIIAYTQDHDVDLVVMSTHGRSGLSRWVYGSIANRVLGTVGVPVLLVRAS